MSIAGEIDSFFAVVIAVKNMDQAIENYKKLGFELIDRSDRKDWGLEAAQFKVGDGVFELLAPVAEDKDVAKTIRKFLDQKGEGVYEIAVNVRNIDAVNEFIKKQGVRTLNEPSPVPVPSMSDRKLLWVSPKSANGVFLEYITSPNKK
jgi:methylmalonyl-CoA/ethylmalonyl-CoA epimerase